MEIAALFQMCLQYRGRLRHFRFEYLLYRRPGRRICAQYCVERMRVRQSPETILQQLESSDELRTAQDLIGDWLERVAQPLGGNARGVHRAGGRRNAARDCLQVRIEVAR